jgi:heptosyltransferase I
MRLLLVKTSSLGDIVHMLPAVSDAAVAIPGLAIDWVLEAPFAPIAQMHPAINQVMPVAIRKWRRHLFQSATWHEINSFKNNLNQTPYDLVLDAQGLIKSAFICMQAHGPRAGLNWASAKEPLASLAYQHKYFVPKGLHAIERNRLLMASALGYEIPNRFSNSTLSFRADISYGISAPKCTHQETASQIFCFHGSARPEKCWPEQHWIALGKELQQQGHTVIFPSGNVAEHQRAQRITQAIGLSDLSDLSGPAPKAMAPMPLDQLIPMLGQARAVVGVDTGLMHLSAALKRPGVGLYIATDPAQFGALPDTHGPMIVNLNQKDSQSVPQVVQALTKAMLG